MHGEVQEAREGPGGRDGERQGHGRILARLSGVVRISVRHRIHSLKTVLGLSAFIAAILPDPAQLIGL